MESSQNGHTITKLRSQTCCKIACVPKAAGKKIKPGKITAIGGEKGTFLNSMKRRCVCMNKLYKAVGKAIAETCEAYAFTFDA